MADSVCKVVEVVGTSISKAISRATARWEPLRHLDWFEVAQVLGRSRMIKSGSTR
jgi:flavin-binding protein dodecin